MHLLKKEKSGYFLESLFIIAFIVGIGTIIYAGTTFVTDNILLNTGRDFDYNTGWAYDLNGAVSAIEKLPAMLLEDADKTVQIYNVLPENLSNSSIIWMQTNHQWLKVYVDNIIIYEFGLHNKTKFGKAFGSIYHAVELPDFSSEKEIRIVFGSYYNYNINNDAPISSIKIGDKSDILFSFIKDSIGNLVFCFCMFELTILFFLLTIIIRLKSLRLNPNGFGYLGIFSFLAGIWILTDSNLCQFIWGNNVVIYLVSFFSFMLLPTSFLFYLEKVCQHGKRWIKNLTLLLVVIYFINLLLYVFNIADLIYTALAIHILIIIVLMSSLYLSYIEWKNYNNWVAKSTFYGLCVMTVLSLISLGDFYTGDLQDRSKYFRLGLFLFILLLAINALQRSLQLINDSIKSNSYKRLIYLDSLTQLLNRRAFYEELQTLSKDNEKENGNWIAFIVIDVKGVEEININRGFKAGDEAITGFANCLKDIFGTFASCFRIDGGEFVVIVKKMGEKELNHYISLITDFVNLYNSEHEIAINFVLGYTAERRKQNIDYFKLYNKAEESMQEEKKKTSEEY